MTMVASRSSKRPIGIGRDGRRIQRKPVVAGAPTAIEEVQAGKHLGLIYRTAGKIAATTHNGRIIHVEEVLSDTYLAADRLARWHNPERATFSTLFCSFGKSYAMRYFLEGDFQRVHKDRRDGTKKGEYVARQVRTADPEVIDRFSKARVETDRTIPAGVTQELNQHQFEVVRMRCAGVTLERIGTLLGMSKERVRQIERDAIGIMRYGKAEAERAMRAARKLAEAGK